MNFLRRCKKFSSTVAEFVWRVSWFVNRNIDYEDISFTAERNRVVFDGRHVIEEIWKRRKGVCRHKALLMQHMIEYAGVEARYVGGYVLANITGEHRKMRLENIDTPMEMLAFATHTGFGHAWVLVHDPSTGWYPLDPTRQKNPLEPVRYDDLPVYVGKYSPFAPDAMPLFRLERIEEYHAYANEVRYGDLRIVESNGTGLVVYNPRKDQIDYYPGGYALVIPSYFNWTYEKYFMGQLPEAQISIYHYDNRYYVKITGIQMPIYILRKGKPIKPLYHSGDYYVYDENDMSIIGGRVYLKTPYYVLIEDVKETTPP